MVGGQVADLDAERVRVGPDRPLNSLFIGGGTPSLFSGDAVQRLLDAADHIVAPGFIELLSSIRRERKAHEHKAADGVTTAIGLAGLRLLGLVGRWAIPTAAVFAGLATLAGEVVSMRGLIVRPDGSETLAAQNDAADDNDTWYFALTAQGESGPLTAINVT